MTALKFTAPEHDAYDVILIGGAMYGSSVAWWLTQLGFDGRILVVERDPSYAMCSTAHTNSCIRQQFSNKVNVRISQFGADFVQNMRHHMNDDPQVPNLPIQSFGYMYLAETMAQAENLAQAQQVQADCGAGTRHMTADEIKAAYPFYNLDDIVAGNHNLIDEGYFDGGTVFDWFRKGARAHGVEYVANEVTALTMNTGGTQVTGVTLATGETVACGKVVNAAGPRAARVATMAGIPLPVEPRKRFTFVFAAADRLDRDLPLTIDPSGVHMRSDGLYYMAGCPPDDDMAVDPDDFAPDHSIWENKVWPVLAHRVPQFERIKLVNEWVGHYAFNTFDQNAILGPHPEVSNFIFVNGFSGHGLQQAPAIGRGTAEMIIHGGYRSLDLTSFHFDRIAQGAGFVEKAII
ncbi:MULTISPECIES: NAD(P)/FAD-dependent oxidoreductase [Roseobacteraceae]|uniref:4-methylaminobutanoate oxidase (Formaldehyde-forming) n=1 Tax=Pseudosulfitobacter pseudonitzschiae TaxID=1402135 RepID=A0A221K5L0_9RHOB|nr:MULTISPECIES: FAD-binding oxidoreductase [Roseobacteraceae]ASM74160.1 4-methylaminobutanoate oxidase (formaldehyde-forming) [Pseudosulfitobacter pseudonitzschiae]